jgi:hypothetical protein
MSDELKFQWGLYIGSHMEENLLEFVHIDESKREWNYDLVSTGNILIKGYSLELKKYNEFYFKYDLCLPQLKSLESLSDEEILWVFLGDKLEEWGVKDIKDASDHITRRFGIASFGEGDDDIINFNITTGEFATESWLELKYIDILNRLHSLHRSENEKALLEAGLIEIVE